MANRKPLIDEDGEVRELTAEEVALFKPFSALPEGEQAMLRRLRENVASAYDATKANPERAVPIDHVRARLAVAHKSAIDPD